MGKTKKLFKKQKMSGRGDLLNIKELLVLIALGNRFSPNQFTAIEKTKNLEK